MPAAGRKPGDGPKHGRTPLTHDWTDVEDVPFKGAPKLPATRPVVDRTGHVHRVKLAAETAAWWRDVSSMPHCVLWTASDWRFAIETALVADMLHQGDRGAAGELRLRERILGTTLDARRDLRIRYVDPEPAAPARPRKAAGARKAASKVSSLEDRRRRLVG